MCTDTININNNIRQSISKAWNWAIRADFGLRRRESTRLLFKYCNLISANCKIDPSQLNLLASLKKCADSKLLHSSVSHAIYSSYYDYLFNKCNVAGYANVMC